MNPDYFQRKIFKNFLGRGHTTVPFPDPTPYPSSSRLFQISGSSRDAAERWYDPSQHRITSIIQSMSASHWRVLRSRRWRLRLAAWARGAQQPASRAGLAASRQHWTIRSDPGFTVIHQAVLPYPPERPDCHGIRETPVVICLATALGLALKSS